MGEQLFIVARPLPPRPCIPGRGQAWWQIQSVSPPTGVRHAGPFPPHALDRVAELTDARGARLPLGGAGGGPFGWGILSHADSHVELRRRFDRLRVRRCRRAGGRTTGGDGLDGGGDVRAVARGELLVSAGGEADEGV